MSAPRTEIQFAIVSLLFAACSTSPVGPTAAQMRNPSHSQTAAKVLTRDEVMGPNRALSSKLKAGKEFLFRNVASAFPDNGKNMLLKDRALSKMSVSGAVDHSPYHLRLYQDAGHVKQDQERFATLNKVAYATALTEREANLLAQAPKKNVPQPFYQTEILGVDDAYEPNNSAQEAFDLSNAENQWLAFLGTEGVQWDQDWYRIWVSSQYREIVLDLRFQHYLGDIDMKLFDSAGHLVAVSQGSGEDEFIHLILEKGGTYFVQVLGSNRGNRYDFKQSAFFSGGGDDEYEDNDLMKNAFDLRQYENKWLSEVRGEAVAADDDFYLIQVPKGRQRVLVDLRCDVDRGDVDVRLINSKGQIVASSSNIGDDDFVDFIVPEAGNYYLKVYPFAPQSTFNMYDLKWTAQKVSQVGSSKSSPKNPERQPSATH